MRKVISDNLNTVLLLVSVGTMFVGMYQLFAKQSEFQELLSNFTKTQQKSNVNYRQIITESKKYALAEEIFFMMEQIQHGKKLDAYQTARLVHLRNNLFAQGVDLNGEVEHDKNVCYKILIEDPSQTFLEYK
jgi:hypothetical protein